MGAALKVLVLVIAAAIAAPQDAWAGNRSGGTRTGAKSGSHHHHHRSVHSSAFLFWSPWWYQGPYYYPYAYPPAVRYIEPAAPVYYEQYVGEPTPDTKEVIYCPNRGAYYPDATDCPGGWARVVE